PGITQADLFQQLAAAIGGSVVYEHDLVVARDGREHAGELFVELLQGAALVEDGDHHRDGRSFVRRALGGRDRYCQRQRVRGGHGRFVMGVQPQLCAAGSEAGAASSEAPRRANQAPPTRPTTAKAAKYRRLKPIAASPTMPKGARIST